MAEITEDVKQRVDAIIHILDHDDETVSVEETARLLTAVDADNAMLSAKELAEKNAASRVSLADLRALLLEFVEYDGMEVLKAMERVVVGEPGKTGGTESTPKLSTLNLKFDSDEDEGERTTPTEEELERAKKAEAFRQAFVEQAKSDAAGGVTPADALAEGVPAIPNMQIIPPTPLTSGVYPLIDPSKSSQAENAGGGASPPGSPRRPVPTPPPPSAPPAPPPRSAKDDAVPEQEVARVEPLPEPEPVSPLEIKTEAVAAPEVLAEIAPVSAPPDEPAPPPPAPVEKVAAPSAPAPAPPPPAAAPTPAAPASAPRSGPSNESRVDSVLTLLGKRRDGINWHTVRRMFLDLQCSEDQANDSAKKFAPEGSAPLLADLRNAILEAVSGPQGEEKLSGLEVATARRMEVEEQKEELSPRFQPAYRGNWVREKSNTNLEEQALDPNTGRTSRRNSVTDLNLSRTSSQGNLPRQSSQERLKASAEPNPPGKLASSATAELQSPMNTPVKAKEDVAPRSPAQQTAASATPQEPEASKPKMPAELRPADSMAQLNGIAPIARSSGDRQLRQCERERKNVRCRQFGEGRYCDYHMCVCGNQKSSQSPHCGCGGTALKMSDQMTRDELLVAGMDSALKMKGESPAPADNLDDTITSQKDGGDASREGCCGYQAGGVWCSKKVSRSGSLYCDDHRCPECGSPKGIGHKDCGLHGDVTLDDSAYTGPRCEHRTNGVSCGRRVGNGSFCPTHTCPVCGKDKSSLRSVCGFHAPTSPLRLPLRMDALQVASPLGASSPRTPSPLSYPIGAYPGSVPYPPVMGFPPPMPPVPPVSPVPLYAPPPMPPPPVPLPPPMPVSPPHGAPMMPPPLPPPMPPHVPFGPGFPHPPVPHSGLPPIYPPHLAAPPHSPAYGIPPHPHAFADGIPPHPHAFAGPLVEGGVIAHQVFPTDGAGHFLAPVPPMPPPPVPPPYMMSPRNDAQQIRPPSFVVEPPHPYGGAVLPPAAYESPRWR